MMGECGSTRKRARSLRWPGREGLARRKGETRCWRTLGKARRRVGLVRIPGKEVR